VNRLQTSAQSQRPHRSPESRSPPSSYHDDGEYSPDASESDDSHDEAKFYARLAKLDETGRREALQIREQQKIFKLAERKRRGEDVDDGPEEFDPNVFYTIFPDFEKNQNPNFVKLFPPRPATYRGKVPLKPPKPVPPTKLSLELLADQEKSFRTPDFGSKPTDSRLHRDGLFFFNRRLGDVDDSDDDLALSVIDEDERIGGVTMQDLAVICGEWDVPSDVASVISEDIVMDGGWEDEELARPRKKNKTARFLDADFSLSIHDPQLPFEDPERATAKLANKITLDLNDPHLLLDEHVPPHKRVTMRDSRRDKPSQKVLAKRYNISNDEQYDQLKENHQHKVRSTLGAMAIEHSLPASRLQYPFYRIALDSKTKRSFHRPQLDVRDGRGREWRFQRQKHIKRKHLRGRETKDLFAKAEDLSLGDNANVTLMEYSEEAPLMLSNFGMGNRLINYYRKRDADDQERPKREIGETQVLLTQDKSPFANFGHVDRGEVVPTVQNGMYRAPVFQHKAKSTDFLVGLSSTYQSGHRFYLRNVENLLTVGQQFPLTEVPGEHSRKVTDAAKKRLRALSYRMYSKSVDPSRPRAKPLNNENLMPHLPGHDMPQTRSKMREFMKYERAPGKDSGGVWVPPPGAVVPDAETLRSWIKPEDICMLDSMQVGVQHLADLGIQDQKNNEEAEKDLDENASIELQLAPWRATKNFLAACQGKAMLKLHGEGDPTGRGEGFSFVKTSMKGGFQALGESAEDKIEAKRRRETSGHSYNVAKQQKAYDDSVRIIWDKQKASLSNEQEDSDAEMEEDIDEPQSSVQQTRGATPRSSMGTPAAFARHEDESASQFSRGSGDQGERVLTITRTTRDKYGKMVPTYEKVTNPRVIQLYRKRRMEKQIEAIKFVSPAHKPFP
jgi:transcription initiation factor TFIID subunit 1, fungi type